MYNYWRGCAENGGNEYLASNRVVGDSNPSGCTIFSKNYDASENCIRLQINNSPIVRLQNLLDSGRPDVTDGLVH